MADTWGGSFGASWSNSWNVIAAPEVIVAPIRSVAIGPHNFGFEQHQRRYEEQEERKRLAQLKRIARAVVKKAVGGGLLDRKYLESLAENRLEQVVKPTETWITDARIEQIASEAAAKYLASIGQRIASEDDEEVLLLLM